MNRFFYHLVVFLVVSFPFLLVYGSALVLILLLVKKLRKNKKSRKQKKQPEQEEKK